jgi:hypothetical protein
MRTPTEPAASTGPHPGPRVCVVGSTNVDLTFRTPRLPSPGETLFGTAFQTGFGGKGANQAVMAARLGARVAFLTRVGRDAFGERVMATDTDFSPILAPIVAGDVPARRLAYHLTKLTLRYAQGGSGQYSIP